MAECTPQAAGRELGVHGGAERALEIGVLDHERRAIGPAHMVLAG